MIHTRGSLAEVAEMVEFAEIESSGVRCILEVLVTVLSITMSALWRYVTRRAVVDIP